MLVPTTGKTAATISHVISIAQFHAYLLSFKHIALCTDCNALHREQCDFGGRHAGKATELGHSTRAQGSPGAWVFLIIAQGRHAPPITKASATSAIAANADKSKPRHL